LNESINVSQISESTLNASMAQRRNSEL
jgi:hypothetical protein